MYIPSMNPIRTAGQKLIPVPVNEDFIRQLDRGLREAGFSNRSQFIRDAVFEKLTAMGRKVNRGLTQPPPRAGKGGFKKGSRSKPLMGRTRSRR